MDGDILILKIKRIKGGKAKSLDDSIIRRILNTIPAYIQYKEYLIHVNTHIQAHPVGYLMYPFKALGLTF